jgi:uncharacterized protein (DUF934 family)
MLKSAMHFIAPHHDLQATGLHLPNTAQVQDHAAQLQDQARVVLHFPKWTDGRAYSQAVLLRSRLRFAGELVASGEVLADMLPLLRRCGFDAVQLRADQSQAVAEQALGYFSTRYQTVPAERFNQRPAAGVAA